MKILDSIVAVSAISLLFLSCDSSENDIIPEGNELVHLSLKVGMEGPVTTRAYFDEFGDEHANFRWEVDDQIALFAAGEQDYRYIFVTEAKENSTYAVAEGDVHPSDTYLAVHAPYSFYIPTKQGENTVTVYIPEEQRIEENKCVARSALIQVGYFKKESEEVDLQAVCSYLVFDTSGHPEITKVEVKAFNDKDGKEAYGIVYAVTASEISEDGRSIKLEKGNTPNNSVWCDYNWGKDYFPSGDDCHQFAIGIRPGGPALIKVTITEGKGETAKKTTFTTSKMDGGAPLNFKRNQYHFLPKFPATNPASTQD